MSSARRPSKPVIATAVALCARASMGLKRRNAIASTNAEVSRFDLMSRQPVPFAHIQRARRTSGSRKKTTQGDSSTRVEAPRPRAARTKKGERTLRTLGHYILSHYGHRYVQHHLDSRERLVSDAEYEDLRALLGRVAI